MGSNLNGIEKFIDKILSNKKWGPKEMNFYTLLQNKVTQYQENTKSFELYQDKQEITTNIEHQEWFSTSKYKGILSSLLLEMEIDTYNYNYQDGLIKSQIIVKFPRSKFCLKSHFHLEWQEGDEGHTVTKLQFYFFLEDFDEVKRAYFAYNDPENELELDLETLKLPQLSEVFGIVKPGAFVSKIELVKLFTEILLFYDESEYIKKTPLGIDSKITLNFFLAKKRSQND